MTTIVQLKKDIPELGRIGQMVEVSQAYARNFLLPKGAAVLATPALIAAAKRSTAKLAEEEARYTATAVAAKSKLTDATVRLRGRANAQGKLFAAVKSDQVIAAIAADAGLRLPSSTRIEPVSFKTVGAHSAQLVVPGGPIHFIVQIEHAERP